MKKTKTVSVPLLSGDKKRIVRDDVICVSEQENIMGGGRHPSFHKVWNIIFNLTSKTRSGGAYPWTLNSCACGSCGTR